MTTDNVRKLVQRAGENARLAFPVRPHMSRHACGYTLAIDGQDTRSIQQYLGHKNIHTIRYTDSLPRAFGISSGIRRPAPDPCVKNRGPGSSMTWRHRAPQAYRLMLTTSCRSTSGRPRSSRIKAPLQVPSPARTWGDFYNAWGLVERRSGQDYDRGLLTGRLPVHIDAQLARLWTPGKPGLPRRSKGVTGSLDYQRMSLDSYPALKDGVTTKR
jgi:Phage integrase family